jgi:dihydroorotate dehydrogenase
MYSLIRPLLFALPPEVAHAVTLTTLNVAARIGALPSYAAESSPVSLFGLIFPNRVGIAAGLDKNGACIDGLGSLGVGFIEIGTVTPRPQVGNARPRLFRLIEDTALINRMGFPNEGVQIVCERLRRRKFAGVCGVNIGKNADTPLQDAARDYVDCLTAVYDCADYVAINVSSPNTAGLRSLQSGDSLRALLDAVVATRTLLERERGRHMPILVKLTADLSDADLIDATRAAIASGIDGIIATNTTVARNGLRSKHSIAEGGLSGAPLLPRALHAVQCIRAEAHSNYPIVGVGGIESAEDAVAMRMAGADLIQIYTGLVYRGPALVREILASSANA